MNDNTVPGVYLLNIDMECGQAKEAFKRMGFTDGEKMDFQRFTPQALSVTPLWLHPFGLFFSRDFPGRYTAAACY